MNEEEILKVASNSSVNKLGGAIAGVVSKGNTPVLTCIGAGSTNQACKAMAIARRMVASSGVDLAFKPGFFTTTIEIDGEPKEITGLKFYVVIT